jgi:uncharacterized membrane protein YfbV (UPF0208 family)
VILGFVSNKDLLDWHNVPHSLPHFQFYENHRIVVKTAFPEKILPAVANFDIQKDAVVKILMSVRQLPQKLRCRPPDTQIRPFGLHSFTLLENSTTTLCYGLRGRFWSSDFGLEDVPDRHAYGAALPSGNAKLLLRYQVRPLGSDEYDLCTETFIYCPDNATRLKMAAYWLAIRAGSGWIRRRMLKAVKRALCSE